MIRLGGMTTDWAATLQLKTKQAVNCSRAKMKTTQNNAQFFLLCSMQSRKCGRDNRRRKVLQGKLNGTVQKEIEAWLKIPR